MSLFLVSITTGHLLCPVDHQPLDVDRGLEAEARAYGMYRTRVGCPHGHSHHWPPVAPLAEAPPALRAQPMGHQAHVWVASTTRPCQDCREPFLPGSPAERRCAACRALPPCWSCRGRRRHTAWCRATTGRGLPRRRGGSLGLALAVRKEA